MNIDEGAGQEVTLPRGTGYGAAPQKIFDVS